MHSTIFLTSSTDSVRGLITPIAPTSSVRARKKYFRLRHAHQGYDSGGLGDPNEVLDVVETRPRVLAVDEKEVESRRLDRHHDLGIEAVRNAGAQNGSPRSAKRP